MVPFIEPVVLSLSEILDIALRLEGRHNGKKKGRLLRSLDIWPFTCQNFEFQKYKRGKVEEFNSMTSPFAFFFFLKLNTETERMPVQKEGKKKRVETKDMNATLHYVLEGKCQEHVKNFWCRTESKAKENII